jgi:hypothetical protein
LGGAYLNQQIFIDGFNLSFEGEPYEIRLAEPVQITGPKRFTVEIPL